MFQIDYILFLRHGAYPAVFFFVIPRIPEHFITAEGGSCGHRKADPVAFRATFQLFKGFFNIFGRHGVLRLKILMKNTDGFVRVVFVAKIQRQVQQKSAVLPAGERNVDIVELLKNELQPALQSFIYILL